MKKAELRIVCALHMSEHEILLYVEWFKCAKSASFLPKNEGQLEKLEGVFPIIPSVSRRFRTMTS